MSICLSDRIIKNRGEKCSVSCPIFYCLKAPLFLLLNLYKRITLASNKFIERSCTVLVRLILLAVRDVEVVVAQSVNTGRGVAEIPAVYRVMVRVDHATTRYC